MKMVFRYLPFAIFLSIAALTEDASTVGKADPQIAAALKQVSAKQIQANIEKLVSFQTRLTISAQDSGAIAAGHGIGAAREWIKGEFERYSRDCGGCLEVKTDSFTESAGPRIPQPTILTNVYAVLKGGDPEAAKNCPGYRTLRLAQQRCIGRKWIGSWRERRCQRHRGKPRVRTCAKQIKVSRHHNLPYRSRRRARAQWEPSFCSNGQV